MTNKELEFDFFKSKNNNKNTTQSFFKSYYILFVPFISIFIFTFIYLEHSVLYNPKIQQITTKIQASQNQTAQLVIQEQMSKKQNISYLSKKEPLTFQQQKQIQEISQQANNIIQNLKNTH